MKVTNGLPFLAFSLSLLALGCGQDAGVMAPAIQSDATASVRATARYSEWSTAVNLGPAVNSPVSDNSPELSRDGLSLYFGSLRPGGVGSTDIYVSRRSSVNDPWGTPVNLGTTINTTRIDGGPTLSRDGHWLFLISDRPGGQGSNDIYVSWRADTHDDFAWGPPVNLGSPVNSAQLEAGPNPWGQEFYFHRGPAVGNTEIYVSRMKGNVFGEPTLVTELDSGGEYFTQRPSIRFDGREMFFSSNRPASPPDGENSHDIWTSTRQGNGQPWTTPIKLGATINTPFQEQTPVISEDGTLLFFTSDRTGNFDLYVATRSVVPEE